MFVLFLNLLILKNLELLHINEPSDVIVFTLILNLFKNNVNLKYQREFAMFAAILDFYGFKNFELFHVNELSNIITSSTGATK